MTLREARDQRRVSTDLRDRCLFAAFSHKAKLNKAELTTLSKVTDAYAAMEFVNKDDIDRAAGILGKLERDG